MRHEGIIAYASGKGWWFAENLSDNSSIFVHQRDVENQRFLKLGDRIEFEVIPSRSLQDKTQAANVKFLRHTIARQTSGDKAVAHE